MSRLQGPLSSCQTEAAGSRSAGSRLETGSERCSERDVTHGQQPNSCMPFDTANVKLVLLVSLTGVKGDQSKGADVANDGRKGAPGAGRPPM